MQVTGAFVVYTTNSDIAWDSPAYTPVRLFLDARWTGIILMSLVRISVLKKETLGGGEGYE